MFTVILIFHVLVCLVLVVSILIQQGKGATMGAAFGTAGSQTVFGSSGAGNFLTKTTSVCAAIFFATSLLLAYRSSFRRSVVDIDDGSSKSVPADTTPPPETGTAPNAPTQAPAPAPVAPAQK